MSPRPDRVIEIPTLGEIPVFNDPSIPIPKVGTLPGFEEAGQEFALALGMLAHQHSYVQNGVRHYDGIPVRYSDSVDRTLREVQLAGNLEEGSPAREAFVQKLLSREGKHWHKNFDVVVYDDTGDEQYGLARHDEEFADQIANDVIELTSDGRPLIYVMPVGPVGHYPFEARKLVKRKFNPDLVFPFAMDESTDAWGNAIPPEDAYGYIGPGFYRDLKVQFFDKLKDDEFEIPMENLHFALARDGIGYGLELYYDEMRRLMDRGARVLYTGGVGEIGHIEFSEGTFAVIAEAIQRGLSNNILNIIGAPLTVGSIYQNMGTSTYSAPFPPHCRTIHLGTFRMLRDYAASTDASMRTRIGLDNVERTLKWQPRITQAMLLHPEADPTLPCTYPSDLKGEDDQGSYTLGQSHLKGFNILSK